MKLSTSRIISEVQIIENLQRQEVEPMEEAEAIVYLVKLHCTDISKGEQKMFYESMGENFRAHTIQHAINTNSYDLQKASFSLSYEKLIKGTGSCNVCPFNSINQGSLFDH